MIRQREPPYQDSLYGPSQYRDSRYGYGDSRYGYGDSRYGNRVSRYGYEESQEQEGPQHISVFRNVYNPSNPDQTDFSRMINLEKYNHVLFIFNDNDRDHETSNPGVNNAEIRVYNLYNKGRLQRYPHSAGIPTGYFPGPGGGYKGLSIKDKTNKNNPEYPYKSILFAYAEIMLFLYIYKKHYTSIIYSVENASSTLLAMGTYQVNYNVIQFISYLLSNINFFYGLSYKIFERSDQDMDKATVTIYNKLLTVVHRFIQNEKKNGKINIDIDHEEERRELIRKEEESAIKKREEERKREEEKDKKLEEQLKSDDESKRETPSIESEDEKNRRANKREKKNERKLQREKEKKRDKELTKQIERERERDLELKKQFNRENEVNFQEKNKEYDRREEEKVGQGEKREKKDEELEDGEEEMIENKKSELKDDAKKMKKRVKGVFKLMEKYKDTLKDINKNETKLYKLLININTEIVNMPNIYYTSSMINKNEEHKYIYVNPYVPFTKETSLYNKNYKIKQREKDRQKKYLNEQLVFNVKEILKFIFKEGTVIYLGNDLKPYVIQGFTSQKAILDDNDKDENDVEFETNLNGAKKPDAIINSLELDEDDVLNTKISAVDIIKISYFNNNKIITTSINLKLFPGKTLPLANSPNIKLFDCLRKKNEVHKKFMVFTGLENWKKSKRNLFENETIVMSPFINDAVYKKYTEGKTDESGNKNKYQDKNRSENKNRSEYKNRSENKNKRRGGNGSRTRRRTRRRTTINLTQTKKWKR